MNSFFSTPVIWELVICSLITILFVWQSKKQSSTRLLHWLPSLWTSAGILGTFVSIYFGLQNLPDDIPLNELVDRVVPAFSTSIIGVGMSILISGIVKLIDSSIEKKEEDDYHSLTDTETPEALLFQIKTLLAKSVNQTVLRESTAVVFRETLINDMKEFKRMLLEDISSFDKTVSALFCQVLSKLDSVVEQEKNHQEQIRNEFEEALRKNNETLLSSYSTMNTAAKEELANICDSIKLEVKQICDNQTTALNSTIDQHEKLLNDHVAKLSAESTNRMEEQNKASLQLQNQIERSMTNLKDAFAQYVDTQNEKMKEAHNNIASSIASYTQRLEDLFVNDIKGIINDFAQKQIEESRTILEGTHQEMLNVATDFLNKQTDLSADAMNRMSESLAITSDKLSSTIDSMKEEVSNSLKDMQVEQVDGINRAMEQTVSDTKAICDTYVANIGNVAETMQTEYNKLIDKMSENNLAFGNRLEESGNAHIEASKGIFASAENKLDDLLFTINNVAAQLNETATNIQMALVSLGTQTIDDTRTVCDSYRVNINNVAESMASSYQHFTQTLADKEHEMCGKLIESESTHLTNTESIFRNAEAKVDDILFSINNLCTSIAQVTADIHNTVTEISTKTVDDTRTVCDAYSANMRMVAGTIETSNSGLADKLVSIEHQYLGRTSVIINQISERFNTLVAELSSISNNASVIYREDNEKFLNGIMTQRDNMIDALNYQNEKQLGEIREMHESAANNLAKELEGFTGTLKESVAISEFETICKELLIEMKTYADELKLSVQQLRSGTNDSDRPNKKKKEKENVPNHISVVNEEDTIANPND